MDETGEPKSTGDALTDDAPADEPGPGHQAPRQGMGRTGVVLWVLGALLVGGIAGVAIGWKVEQQRVKDDLANIRPVGRITEVTDDPRTIEIRTANGTQTYQINDDTLIEAVGSDDPVVDKGTIVLVKSKEGSGSQRVAVEVIVLPETTTFAGGSGG